MLFQSSHLVIQDSFATSQGCYVISILVESKNPNTSFPQRLRPCHLVLHVSISSPYAPYAPIRRETIAERCIDTWIGRYCSRISRDLWSKPRCSATSIW